MYQERLGWERPGWFSVEKVPVQKYDWYGAYETPKNENDLYKKNLDLDYTFDFPLQHENVRKHQDMSFFQGFKTPKIVSDIFL